MSYLVLHTNGVYITLVLSVVRQKMKAYLQELILGTFTVTFFHLICYGGARWCETEVQEACVFPPMKESDTG